MTLTKLNKSERYLLTVRQEETDRPPIWIMRQAGRYMPEYQAMRKEYSFMELCRTPEAAAHTTLLPLEILDIDIMIIFNDILIPLEEMGLDVQFLEGGPQIIDPVQIEDDLERFRAVKFSNPEVAQSIALTKSKAPDVPILGFCGAPFTMALYAIEGKLGRNPRITMELLYSNPKLLHEILERITETVGNYLISQIDEGGADGVQIFESWGGFLSPGNYINFAEVYQKKLIQTVKAACPETPVHVLAKGANHANFRFDHLGADVLSVDWQVKMCDVRKETSKTIQGNLDPLVLNVPDAVEKEFYSMLEGFDWRRGWIANLGHGITPQAAVQGAKNFVRCVKELK